GRRKTTTIAPKARRYTVKRATSLTVVMVMLTAPLAHAQDQQTPAAAQPKPAPTQVTKPAPTSPAQPTTEDPPASPGLYILADHEYTKILGQPMTFERTGSRLVSGLTLHIKAEHNNIQLPGATAQTITGSAPVFAFIPSQRESENGVTSGDLILIK